MKILSVDDSGIIRKLIKSVADMLGYGFLEAANGQEAIEILASNYNDIALVILDWNMPVKDGFQTLLEIKEDPRFQRVPVMMATTESERSNIIRAIQAGARHYLTKPFTQEDLATRIAECLEMQVC